MVKAKEIIAWMDEIAPPVIAEQGDPIGLQLGDVNQEIQTVYVTLDVRPETVAAAIEVGADMILAHHPAMFVPVRKFDMRDSQNRMYAEIIKHDLVVYAAHTNLDNAPGGMNDWLAQALNLSATSGLLPAQKGPVGTYAMGRVGDLPQTMTVAEFSDYCKKTFHLSGLRLISKDLNATIKKVAVLGGSGGKFYSEALKQGADAYVTGDISYHTGHDILASGLHGFDLGHHIEAICEVKLSEGLTNQAQKAGWQLKIVTNQINTDPFTFR